MKFESPQQRRTFASACHGDWRDHHTLPPELASIAFAGAERHNERGRLAGVHQDPLAIRARWPSFAECQCQPEAVALAAISSLPIKCSCRTCRLRKATRFMATASQTTPDQCTLQRALAPRAWLLSQAWANIPEASTIPKLDMTSMNDPSIGAFIGSCMDTFCRSATTGDFHRFKDRFELTLKSYGQHMLVGHFRAAAPLRLELITILSDVINRRRKAERESQC